MHDSNMDILLYFLPAQVIAHHITQRLYMQQGLEPSASGVICFHALHLPQLRVQGRSLICCEVKEVQRSVLPASHANVCHGERQGRS